jgi:hypothetical protein
MLLEQAEGGSICVFGCLGAMFAVH